MLDTILEFIFYLFIEVISFNVGRFCLRVLTLGRFNSRIDDHRQGWVSLVGFLVILVLIIGFGVWMNN
ncbi:hypothetical protein [Sulfuriferula nivalis]|uniref:Uncharacterized protein n=1 Tax=Sulfuriferula nivalis TaxID=2675298 RepID=A0A809SCL5_9PROT|nr:hypothetical protein [Sulfuriferula nivalis]BBO99966.1 hypothetical protein SFSGTM_06750 [Sulfuriferula nivalis]